MSINFDLVGVRLMNTFLRIEIVLKLSEKKEYSEECSKIIVHQIQRGMDEVQYLSKTYFHAEHIPFVPKGADVRYLSPPTQPAGCTETDQWKYSSCDLSTITSNDEQTHITPYGYLLLVGLVVEFRSLLYCARHAITCRRYGAARDKLRSAFALYAKHLKQVETAPDMTELNTNLNVSADIPSLPKWGVSSLSSLVGKCGDISPTSPESMTFQLKRQFDIAMQVLVRFEVFWYRFSFVCLILFFYQRWYIWVCT